MSTPVVSIILPNYNHSKYLEKRLASILNQTYQDFEVIILDDCSTDNSREVIEQYKSNPKVTSIVYNDTYSGCPFNQWDKGIQLAKGEYIWIAESDDCCSAELLSMLLRPLEEDKECVLSFCRSALIDSNGNSMGFHNLQKDMNDSFIVEGKKFIQDYLFGGNCIVNASAVVFRKDALKEINDAFRNFHYCGDIIFWSELARKGRVAYCSKPLNSYRRHPQNQINIGCTPSKREAAIHEEHLVARYFVTNHFVSPARYLSYTVSKIWYAGKDSQEANEFMLLKKEYPQIYYRILVKVKGVVRFLVRILNINKA